MPISRDLVHLPSPLPAASPEGLRTSAENIVARLRGTHAVDVFEPARMDQTRFPIEDVIRNLVQLKEEGLFKHIGLSECAADTVRRAYKACPWSFIMVMDGYFDLCRWLTTEQIHPLVTCEIDVSLWSYEEETKKGGCGWSLRF